MVSHLQDSEIMVQKIPEHLEFVDEIPRGNPPMRKILKYKPHEQFG